MEKLNEFVTESKVVWAHYRGQSYVLLGVGLVLGLAVGLVF